MGEPIFRPDRPSVTLCFRKREKECRKVHEMVGVWDGRHRLKLKWARMCLAEKTVPGVQQEEFGGKLPQETRDPLRDSRKQGQAHTRQVLS